MQPSTPALTTPGLQPTMKPRVVFMLQPTGLKRVGFVRRTCRNQKQRQKQRYLSCSAQPDENGSPIVASNTGRIGDVKRVTKETNVRVKLNLDGCGISECCTGIPFLDHMLDQLASHGLLDVHVQATGDIHIDDHHTNEDVALAIGTALLQALGDRKGINRFGDFSAPLDEALVHVSLDLSGRPHLSYGLQIPTERVGTYDTQLVDHFFQSLVNTSGMTLHIRQLAGKNSHHIMKLRSRLLPGLFGRQLSMTQGAVGLFQAPKEFYLVRELLLIAHLDMPLCKLSGS